MSQKSVYNRFSKKQYKERREFINHLENHYRPIRVLHHSDSMDVILVEHTGLGVIRVLKEIKKQPTAASGDASFQLRRESLILKKLKHPGIPVIYDYWEDSDEICLIEEYVEGLSLQEYLLRYPRVDLRFISELVLQILDILIYLHGQDTPILHQDLKTEHIFIRGDQVVLIDYGISEFLRTGGALDTSADIYQSGCIMAELLDHCCEYVPHSLSLIVCRACSIDEAARYSSAPDFRDDIYRWCSHHKKHDKTRLLTREIAVIGNQRGIGTTHIAISIASYLTHAGYSSFYRNLSGWPYFLALGDNLNTDFHEKDGIIYHKWFRGIIDYGPGVEPLKLPDGICVSDCGTDFTKSATADILIYVVGSRPWQSRQLMEEYVSQDSCIMIITPANAGMAISLARATGHKVFSMPYDENPMHPDRKVRKLYEQIFSRFTTS